MEKRELFSRLAAFPPVFVRLDGRSFHRLAETLGLSRPFDGSFSTAMCGVCVALLQDSGLAPAFAYTFSDEISLYFDRLPFDGRVEKIDSVSASYAASALTLALRLEGPVAFDARVITVTPAAAADYLVQRQREAWRNHCNAYCQHALVSDGMSMREAAAALKGMGSAAMHDMMFARGINLARTPAWERRGVLVFRVAVEKEGFNPVTGETVTAIRREISVDRDLPLFSEPAGAALIRSLAGSG
ncbi:MAG: tRNA 5'-guanylyltransferase [Methanomicrobiales archaeon]|nr:tRNA 5'-guanylyltransferase [Methanomicrobiales archaeon]